MEEAGVKGRRVERQQATLAVAGNPDGRPPRCVFGFKVINGRKRLLHLIPDDVPAYFEAHAVEELAVRKVRPAHSRQVRPNALAVDQNRNENLAALLGEAPGVLRAGRHPSRETGQHFGLPIRIGKGDDARGRR